MADGSHIEWTDATWNPLVGCTKVSAGCDNCYAEGEVTRRHAAARSPKTSPKMLEAFPATFDRVSIRPDRFLLQPLTWTKPRRIFVNSLSDLFHADVPDEFIARVFAVMALAHQHSFQLLTKRHARMRSLLNDDGFQSEVAHDILALAGVGEGRPLPDHLVLPQGESWWPLPNVWLGVSVEDQHWADIRIPALLGTPAAVRWISAEPLLGTVDLRATSNAWGSYLIDGIDWVVAGGESGAGARPMHPDWARGLRDQCDDHGVPFLFKQWGAWRHAAECADFAVEEAMRAAGTYDQWLRFRVYDVRLDGSAEIDRVPAPGVSAQMQRVGKSLAGRELDGRTHDGYPQVITA